MFGGFLELSVAETQTILGLLGIVAGVLTLFWPGMTALVLLFFIGGCDGKIANRLPIMKSWNYVVRPYRPRPEIMNGRWKFPQAQPVTEIADKPWCSEERSSSQRF